MHVHMPNVITVHDAGARTDTDAEWLTNINQARLIRTFPVVEFGEKNRTNSDDTHALASCVFIVCACNLCITTYTVY